VGPKRIFVRLDSSDVRSNIGDWEVRLHALGCEEKEKQSSIYRAIAYHLGQVKHDFDNNLLHDDTTLNMDETHFIANMDDGKTLDFCGSSSVNHHDVVSGGESVTLVVTLV
jgi:hypothetical protein